MVVGSKPVFSSIARDKVMTVVSGIGTWSNVATRWILAILAHKSVIGSSRFHGSDSAARLRSSSTGVMVPYSARRWGMSHGETSLKPKLGSSKALRKDELTAVRVLVTRAVLRQL